MSYVNEQAVYNSGASINASCLAWWPVGEGSGTTIHDITGNTGNAISTTGTWTTGASGPIYTGPKITTGALTLPNTYTASVWFNCGSSSNYHTCFAMYNDSSSNDKLWDIGIYNGKMYALNGNGSTFFAGKQSTLGVSDGTWGNMVMTNNNGTVQVWVNGTQDTTFGSWAADAAPGTSAQVAYIGFSPSAYGNTPDYNATITPTNCRIWGRVLSGTEIASLYSTPWIGSGGSNTNRFFFGA